ncbi:MAG TPA: carbohydrate kinase family protein [Candidatus Paceibacterota bacterium]|nr:carbohydrate kinase family protein [Candidatus Paceibacterota bacterium]
MGIFSFLKNDQPSNAKFDFIAIGDITTDAFIRLKEAHVTCKVNKEDCEICMKFGDKLPYESVTIVDAVGNSPNAAVSASRLGLKAALITNVGDDQAGADAIKHIANDGIDTRFIASHPGKKTNYHYVLWYGDERTILIKHETFDYKLPDIGSPSWIYLSSLGDNSLPFHQELGKYLQSHPEIKLAFQPGTFQIKLGAEQLKDIYARTEIFFCNVEEAKRILGTENEIKSLLDGIRSLGPKIAVISDGPRGAYASDGNGYWFMPIYPDPKPPVDRTGAGDSFSSTFTSAIALGKTIPEALAWGPINSMSVVQYVGAQEGLLKREKLEGYLAQAPADYVAKEI